MFTCRDWTIWGRKEGNVFLFNDALNSFSLRLYGVRHMVKDHSDSEKGNPLPPHRLLFGDVLPSSILSCSRFTNSSHTCDNSKSITSFENIIMLGESLNVKIALFNSSIFTVDDIFCGIINFKTPTFYVNYLMKIIFRIRVCLINLLCYIIIFSNFGLLH